MYWRWRRPRQTFLAYFSFLSFLHQNKCPCYLHLIATFHPPVLEASKADSSFAHGDSLLPHPPRTIFAAPIIRVFLHGSCARKLEIDRLLAYTFLRLSWTFLVSLRSTHQPLSTWFFFFPLFPFPRTGSDLLSSSCSLPQILTELPHFFFNEQTPHALAPTLTDSPFSSLPRLALLHLISARSCFPFFLSS